MTEDPSVEIILVTEAELAAAEKTGVLPTDRHPYHHPACPPSAGCPGCDEQAGVDARHVMHAA